MFAGMKSMVMEAWHGHYALLAINCVGLKDAHTATYVAGENRTLIILNLYQGYLAHFPAPVTAVVVRTLAGSVPVPVTLALDHGKNPDCIRQASRAGFNGLMIDTSTLPLEESVRQTRTMVELIADAQLCVEGGLGHLADTLRYNQAANADAVTQPTDVEPFIVQTGIDLLAVSIGTAHGVYALGVIPAIDSQHLTKIFHCSSTPLALHDGSGTPSDQLQLCTTLGVTKINVGAAIFEQGKSVLLHTLCHDIPIKPVDALEAMELTFEEAIIPYLQASGSIGKA